MRVETIDLHFQGSPRVIAAYLVIGPGGPVLIESGPGSTLKSLVPGLEQHGVKPSDIADVLVTHIHLDHAGAAGWWARQGARVHVHPRGAPHLIDPTKLLASATRIYGDRMDTLWGDVLSAPADRVHAVEDGDVIEAGGLEIRVVETTGHARHHHAFVIGDVVFAGDAAGIRLPGARWVDLPAPPPEFDLEAWQATVTRLRGLKPRTLYRTHFDAGDDPDAELVRLRALLDDAVGWIAEMMEAGIDREAMVREFSRRMRDRAAAESIEGEPLHSYELSNPRVMSVDGIARYLTKRAQARAGSDGTRG